MCAISIRDVKQSLILFSNTQNVFKEGIIDIYAFPIWKTFVHHEQITFFFNSHLHMCQQSSFNNAQKVVHFWKL